MNEPHKPIPQTSSGLILGSTICAAILLAIWPLPETMALRYLMLLVGGLLGLIHVYHNRQLLFQAENWHLVLLPTFFLWLLIHLAVFSPDSSLQIKELTSVWFRSFLAMLLGFGLGLVLRTVQQPSLVALHAYRLVDPILIAGFSGTLLIYTLRYFFAVYQTGIWIQSDFFSIQYLTKPPIVIFIGIFLPILLIKLSRSIKGNASRIWIPLSILLIFIAQLAFYTAGTKNGIALFAFTLTITGLKFIFELKSIHRKVLLIIAGIALMMTPSFLLLKKHYDSNMAWQTLIADARVGFDIKNQSHWKEHTSSPIPVNEYGKPVNDSTYLRTAWATAGLQLIIENPFGYGLIDKAFTDQARKKWPDFQTLTNETIIATHSGWIDFTLILGLPGTLLLLCALWSPLFKPAQTQSMWEEYLMITVPALTFGYLFTEVAKDIFFEFFIFLSSLFSILRCVGNPPDKAGLSSSPFGK